MENGPFIVGLPIKKMVIFHGELFVICQGAFKVRERHGSGLRAGAVRLLGSHGIHGAGIFTYKPPKIAQFCRKIFQHHGAYGLIHDLNFHDDFQ